MPAYDPRDAVILTARRGAPAQRVTVSAGVTLAHVAATEMAGADEFVRLARANGVTDPIPFVAVPPYHLRRGSVVVGERLIIPEDSL